VEIIWKFGNLPEFLILPKRRFFNILIMRFIEILILNAVYPRINLNFIDILRNVIIKKNDV
jgi:hypothetical protein